MAASSLTDQQRERVLLCLREITRGNPLVSVRVEHLAQDADLAPHQIRAAGLDLEARGWALVSLDEASGGVAHITPAGIQEANRLKVPRRESSVSWEMILAAVVLALSALVTLIVVFHLSAWFPAF